MNRTDINTYRPDIDGLRAIAVLSVVGYHAAPSFFPGGFVGVDIFFVISGYLISSIIIAEVKAGKFSFSAFYARRVRRIFPALAVVVSTVLLVGWTVLFIDDFTRLGKHAGAAAIFIANVAFNKEVGYFDLAAEHKPLLHLWSLGVEEQFYIVWPLVLWAAIRYRIVLPTIMVIGAYSLFRQLHGIESGKTASAFYLANYRAWELLLGAALTREWRVTGYFATISALGLSLIAASIFGFHHQQPYPGWRSLLPTLGAALIIASGSRKLVNRALAVRPLVWVGLISYALYLWHWPILSYLRILDDKLAQSTPWLALAVMASFGLAALTYYFVEVPIRRSHRARTVSALTLTLAILGGLGFAIAHQSIKPRNSTPEIDRVVLAANAWEYPKANTAHKGFPLRTLHAGPKSVVFVGDSTVEQYWPRIAALVTREPARANSAIFVTGGGCAAIPGVHDHQHSYCKDMLQVAMDQIKQPAVSGVVIGGSWMSYLTSEYEFRDLGATRDSPQAQIEALDSLRKFLREIAALNKRVLLILNTPSHPLFDPKSMLRRSWYGEVSIETPTVLRSAVEQASGSLQKELNAMSNLAGVEGISPLDFLCSDNECPVVTPEGTPIYKDVIHLHPGYVRDHVGYLDSIMLN